MINLSQNQFQKIVDDAVADIPKKFLDKLSNVAIMVQNFPSPNQLLKLGIKSKKGSARPYLLLGLYEGVPQTKRWGGGSIYPDKITIFKGPIEYLSNSEKDVRRIVCDTVKHEVAHHFGFSEEDIRRAQKK